MEKKRRNRRVQAVIILVLLLFLQFNAKMVVATDITAKNPVTENTENQPIAETSVELREGFSIAETSDEIHLTAGVLKVMEEQLCKPTIVAPENDFVQSANMEVDVNETESQDNVENFEKIVDSEVEATPEPYYVMTEEEYEISCKAVVAEAGNQDLMGKVYMLNCAINNAKELNINLVQEFKQKGRYSSVINGEVCIVTTNKIGEKQYIPVSENMITDEVRKAVETACQKDYTEEILQSVALKKGITDEAYYKGGAKYFYNPNGGLSDEAKAARENISVSFAYQDHVFYRSWN